MYDKGIHDTMEWVDGEWPYTPQIAMLRLWQMYEEEKKKRIHEGVQGAEENYKLVLENRELDKINNLFYRKKWPILFLGIKC